MPKYSKADINFIVERKDLLDMLNAAQRFKDKAILIILWITGARPSELIEIKHEDIAVLETKLNIKLTTKKLGSGGFMVRARTLEIERPTPPDSDNLLEWLVAYLIKNNRPGLLFPVTTMTIENIVSRAARKGLRRNLCPYNFRHGRMTMLGRSGATIDELMHFKGAANVQSVSPYIHARPFKVKV